MSPAEERIRKGIAKLLLSKPFYASILLQLKLVEDPPDLPFPTIATDGRRLLYNTKFINGLNAAELQGALAHEATHIAALHPLRREQRDPMLWNIAADTEVNHIVGTMEGMTLPPDGVPGKPGPAEQHYQKDLEKLLKCGCGGKDGDEEGDEGEGEGQGDDCPVHGDREGKGWCRVLKPELGAGESAAEVEAELMDKIRTAATRAKMAGNMPAGLEQMLDELLAPKVPWEDVLRKFVEAKMEPCVDWASPSRRYLHRGIILPGNGQKRTLSDVALAVDVSGSMGVGKGSPLVQACSEVAAVVDEVYRGQSELPVIWFDCEYHLDFITNADEMVPKGGGGTDFSCVMRCVKEEDLAVKGLIVITDGYCGSFGKEPDMPVMWAVFGDYADAFSPPFGQVLKIELD